MHKLKSDHLWGAGHQSDSFLKPAETKTIPPAPYRERNSPPGDVTPPQLKQLPIAARSMGTTGHHPTQETLARQPTSSHAGANLQLRTLLFLLCHSSQLALIGFKGFTDTLIGECREAAEKDELFLQSHVTCPQNRAVCPQAALTLSTPAQKRNGTEKQVLRAWGRGEKHL